MSINPWDMDPDEDGGAPQSPAAKPKSTAPKVAEVDDDMMVSTPMLHRPGARSVGVVNDETKEAAKLAAKKTVAAIGTGAAVAGSKLQGWMKDTQAKMAEKRVAAAQEKTRAEEEKAQRDVVYGKKEKQRQVVGERSPLVGVIEMEEITATPKIKTDMFRGPNTKLYPVFALLGLLALGGLGWYFYQTIPPQPAASPVATPTPAPTLPAKKPAQPVATPAAPAATVPQVVEQPAVSPVAPPVNDGQPKVDLSAPVPTDSFEPASAYGGDEVEAPAPRPAPVRAAPVKTPTPKPQAKAGDDEDKMLQEQMNKLENWGEKHN